MSTCWYWFPVIVTAAPLFTVDIRDPAGYAVNRADYVPLAGRFRSDGWSLVWIVQADKLSEYVRTAVKGAQGLRITSG